MHAINVCSLAKQFLTWYNAMMKTIPVGKRFALVDDEDFDKLKMFKWRLDTKGYAQRTVHDPELYKRTRQGNRTILMHREIMQALKGFEVDHRNGLHLDNQRCNLRLATRSQNMRNQTKAMNKSSQFKGVSWHVRNKKWMSQITIHRKMIHLGRFDDEVLAAMSYDRMAQVLHGEFAKLNFGR